MTGKIKLMECGCPQGSVLGLVLLSLYVWEVFNSLPKEVHYASYANDSIVVYSGNSVHRTAERSLEVHFRELCNLGMIVHEDKTEIICITRDKAPTIMEVKNGACINSKWPSWSYPGPQTKMVQSHFLTFSG